jgi:hypothetical protein
MRQSPRRARVGDIEDRRAVVFHRPRQGIEGAARMVAHVGDPALALAMDHRLVARAPVESVHPDQVHVARVVRNRIQGDAKQQ